VASDPHADLIALNDPTLFALPRPESFSGLGWLRPTPVPSKSFEWSEDPRWLRPQVQDLGKTVARLYPYSEGGSAFARVAEPELAQPLASLPPVTEASTMEVVGALAQRGTSGAGELPSWAHPELLTNSIVRLAVRPDGLPVSLTLLVSSGLRAADSFALERARQLRWSPIAPVVSDPLQSLAWGEVIFHWRTDPLATNGLGLNPQ
jgi:hypothetical protein